MSLVQILTLIFILTLISPTSAVPNLPEDGNSTDDRSLTIPKYPERTLSAPGGYKHDLFDPNTYLEGEIYKSCGGTSYKFLVVVFNSYGSCDGFLLGRYWVMVGYNCFRHVLGMYQNKMVRTRNLPIRFRKVIKMKVCERCDFVVLKMAFPGLKKSSDTDYVTLPSLNVKMPCSRAKYLYGVVRNVREKISSYWLCADIEIKKCEQSPWSICGNYSFENTKDQFYVDMCTPRHHGGGGLFCEDGVIYGFLSWDSCSLKKPVFSNLSKWMGWISTKMSVRSEEVGREVVMSKSDRVGAGCMVVFLVTGASFLWIFQK